VKYDLIRPCKDCPFRTDIRPFLTTARAEEIAETLLSGGTFACHKTVDYSGDDEDEDGFSEGQVTGQSQHCAGAMIMLEKMEMPNQMMRIAERLGMYRPDKLDMEAPVFEDDVEFAAVQPR
jgi:hypothetical protein